MADAPPDKTPKLLAGCGGCGCAFALLALIAGGIVTVIGLQPATDEALPVGIGLLILSVVAAVPGGGLLAVGMMKLSAQQKAAAAAPPPPPV